MKKLSYFFIALGFSVVAFSMELNERIESDLPELEISGQDSIRIVYQGEAAFLHNTSAYDYLVTTNLWPCIGLVFSTQNNQLMIHKDSATDVASIAELLNAMNVSQSMNTVKVTIFSRKMRDDIYQERDFFKEYRGLTQEQEMQRLKEILITKVKILPENINLVLSTGFDNGLVVNKAGQVFRAHNFNKNFTTVPGVEQLSRGGFCLLEEVATRQQVDRDFLDESDRRFKEAYKDLKFSGYLQLKPFMNDTDAPKNWPRITGGKCEIANCHHLAKMKCARCKAATYCSRGCQLIHWKAGHNKVCTEVNKK